ncbi:hypothetical protein ES705_12378 [subsurface metagenome]
MEPERIVKKFSAELLRKRGVVTVGLGTKVVGGVDTGETALVVGVKQKLALSRLAPEDVVPFVVNDLITDVIEVGEIKLLKEEPDRTKKWRPAPGGVSIGHKDITAGTLGRLVRKNGELMILSNNHVLANINQAQIGDFILQPGPFDGGTVGNEIARLHEFVEIKMLGFSQCPVSGAIASVFNFIARLLGRKTRITAVAGLEGNLVDCAIAKPYRDEDVVDTILEVGVISDEVEPEVGMEVKKSGRTSGLTHGQINQVNVSANVNMGDDRLAIFMDQFAMGAISEPGDSGSIILDEGNRAVGLLFAGSDAITLANKASNVRKGLGLD